ncbi:IclR family transcriptional regulator domain-containing protein [Streptomyces paludis]|uniref:MarR family transcriptional regulator n=1 Tax=Streptomyces paludis TaxID=2282738 RepID=A0A345HYT9_9ACTN|nr:IclR family transcriptional regulator C-terminal domain-containing protein [Streptomyces paludis]AXG81863.1 MarR family transcriptional regulator [Streptomyces paludis]
MTAKATKTSTASSLRTGLRIINTVLERELSGRTGFTVGRLARELDLEASKASRTVQELCDKGFLERREDTTLRVAHAYFALARSLDPTLLRRGRAVLRALAVRHSAAAHLSVRDGVLVRLLRAESATGLAGQSITRSGLITPCWSTGTGRALLLDHTRTEITELLDGYELIGVGGPTAARSADDLVRANDHDRPGAVVVAHGEFEHGVSEYATPVRDRHGHIHAAISVLGRQRDLTPGEAAIRADLTTAAASLTRWTDAQHPT